MVEVKKVKQKLAGKINGTPQFELEVTVWFIVSNNSVIIINEVNGPSPSHYRFRQNLESMVSKAVRKAKRKML